MHTKENCMIMKDVEIIMLKTKNMARANVLSKFELDAD